MSGHNISKQLYRAPEARDPGASGTITVDRSPHVVALVSAAAETRTLARPTKVGAQVFLWMKTDGGDITLTVTGGYNEDADTSFTFDDAGEFFAATAAYDGTDYYWRKTSDHTSQILSQTEAGYLEDVTAGTWAVSKAMTLDSSGDATAVDGTDIALGTTTGTKFSTTTLQKLAFHGSTPVVQRTNASQAAVGTTAATNDSLAYGFTTAGQADGIITLLNEVRAALVEKGLIKGS